MSDYADEIAADTAALYGLNLYKPSARAFREALVTAAREGYALGYAAALHGSCSQ